MLAFVGLMASRSGRFATAFFTAFAGALVVACGGSAFTTGGGGGGTDSGVEHPDATADTGVSPEAGSDGGGMPTEGGPGVDSGGPPATDAGSDAGTGTTCTQGSQCTTGFCKAGRCAPCTLDADCGAGKYCELATGICRDSKTPGEACLTANQCASGFCTDGVCCSTACSSTCEACNTTSSPGTCVPVMPGTNNPTRPCATGDVCCPTNGMGEVCVDTSTSPENCGGCGKPCASNLGPCVVATCNNGACGDTLKAPGSSCGDGGICSAAGVCSP